MRKITHIAAAVCGMMLGEAISANPTSIVNVGHNTTPLPYYEGQSFKFHVGDVDNFVFSFLDSSGNRVSAGSLYLFDYAYSGTVAGLNSAANVLGTAVGSNGFYTFDPSLVLKNETQYYVFADAPQTLGYSIPDQYADGLPYFVAQTNFQVPYDQVDHSFIISANVLNPVPEVATWELMIIGFGAIGASMRRREVVVSFG